MPVTLCNSIGDCAVSVQSSGAAFMGIPSTSVCLENRGPLPWTCFNPTALQTKLCYALTPLGIPGPLSSHFGKFARGTCDLAEEWSHREWTPVMKSQPAITLLVTGERFRSYSVTHSTGVLH